jgi:NAD(P)-dependent dehydrogenase (short-subunit alcohol dehydrogenase family)
MQLQHARVWLTGASSGIGEALVPELTRRGARVAVTARRGDKLEGLARGWRADGADILVVPGDMSRRDEVLETYRRIEAPWGGVDVAIFNAGTHSPASGAGFDSRQFQDLALLNYLGPLFGIEAVLPGMLARRHGQIVGVASVAGYRALPTAAAYGASKAALNFALDALRFDLEPRGITVTVVNPGFIQTPLTERNTFRMPFLMPVDRAVRVMARDIERDKKESRFPYVFTSFVKLMRVLPYPVYERLIRFGTRGQQRTRRSVIGD